MTPNITRAMLDRILAAVVFAAALAAGGPSHALGDTGAQAACSRASGPPGIEAAKWVGAQDASALQRPGAGRVAFVARDGHELALHYYRPVSFDPASGPIWFVMHGRGRDASRYAREAAAPADRYRALVIAIEFPRDAYPGSDSYTLGVVARGKPDASALRQGRWRAPADFLYNEVERVFESVRAAIGGKQAGYFIFGHSAGAQFTHRLVTFVPCARVLRAVAANAGWYTLAQRDAAHAFPYSLRETPPEASDVRALLAAPLTVLLGSKDTTEAGEDDDVRASAGAMEQGSNRLARGRNYFDNARALAHNLHVPFGWKLVVAPGAHHDAAQVIGSAAWILFSPAGETACMPDASPAAAQAVAIRAFRADGAVELANKGVAPVCLTGWTVRDDAGRVRWVVPVGPALAAGNTVLVAGSRSHAARGSLALHAPQSTGDEPAPETLCRRKHSSRRAAPPEGKKNGSDC